MNSIVGFYADKAKEMYLSSAYLEMSKKRKAPHV
jgi:hypothetical protein